jgi:hypothetical protein
MRKIIFLIVIINFAFPVFAKEIFFGEIRNASQYNLSTMEQKAKIALQDVSQPCNKFRYKYFKKSDILFLWGYKNILIKIPEIKQAYQSGIISLVGIMKYDRKGYIRNESFFEINTRMKQLYQYDINTSTN